MHTYQHALYMSISGFSVYVYNTGGTSSDAQANESNEEEEDDDNDDERKVVVLKKALCINCRNNAFLRKMRLYLSCFVVLLFTRFVKCGLLEYSVFTCAIIARTLQLVVSS